MAVPLLFVALGGAACGGDEDDSAGVAVEQPIGAPREGAPDSAPGPQPSVAKHASVEMEVARADLTDAAQEVVDLATSPRVGGFLVSSVLDLDDGYGYGTIVVNVPAPRFEHAVVEVGTIGEVTRQEMAGEDLTPEALAALRAVQRATARTAALAGRLEDTDDPTARAVLMDQLETARAAAREASSERSYVESQTAYAPIDVSLVAKRPPPPPEEPPLERSIATAKTIALGIASGTVLAAGILGPVGALLAVLYLVWSQVVRRLRVRWADLGR